MQKFRMSHISKNGDKVTFDTDKIVLSDYKELIKAKYEKKIDLKIKISSDKIILNDDVTNIKYNTVDIKGFKPTHEYSVFGLTIGGWTPFSFIEESLPLLVDRNVIDRIKKIVSGKDKEFVSTDWWLRPDRDSILTINPLLYAIEGNRRKAPNLDEFCESFNGAGNAIVTYSPSFKPITYSKEDCEGVFNELVKVFHELMEQEIKFLCEVIPLLWQTQKTEILPNLENRINNKAKEYNIYQRLSHLAVLDLLYEDTSIGISSHGRKLLKPKEVYAEEDAYNALSDLLNLEILLHISKNYDNVFFCTTDFHLAAFWVGLGLHNVRYENGKFNTRISTENLFPRAEQLFSV